jgi:hypothetical protein
MYVPPMEHVRYFRASGTRARPVVSKNVSVMECQSQVCRSWLSDAFMSVANH